MKKNEKRNNIAFLGDTHFGYRIKNKHYTEYVKRFYSDVFFPTLKDNQITDVIQFGDLLDDRFSISILTFDFIKNTFLNPLRDEGIQLYVILGFII